MAKYDHGGGCACGLKKTCDCSYSSLPMTDRNLVAEARAALACGELPSDEPAQIVCTGEAGSDTWCAAFGTWSIDDWGMFGDEPLGTGERLFVNRRIYDAVVVALADRVEELEAALSLLSKVLPHSPPHTGKAKSDLAEDTTQDRPHHEGDTHD